jgi:hypothetical protein
MSGKMAQPKKVFYPKGTRFSCGDRLGAAFLSGSCAAQLGTGHSGSPLNYGDDPTVSTSNVAERGDVGGAE